MVAPHPHNPRIMKHLVIKGNVWLGPLTPDLTLPVKWFFYLAFWKVFLFRPIEVIFISLERLLPLMRVVLLVLVIF